MALLIYICYARERLLFLCFKEDMMLLRHIPDRTPALPLTAFLLAVVSAGLAGVQAQTTEITDSGQGARTVISPWTYWCPSSSNCHPERGRFYFPTGVRVGTDLILYVQGGAYKNVLTGPGSECTSVGEEILAFSAPWTSTGLRSPFTYRGAVTPCGPNTTNRHYEGGSSLRSTTDGKVKLFVSETGDNTDPAGGVAGTYKRVLVGTSADGITDWQWDTFITQSDVTLENGALSRISVNNMILVQATANTNWWGVFHWRYWGRAEPNMGRIRVIMDPSNPRGYVVWLLAANGVDWKAVHDDGTFDFEPWKPSFFWEPRSIVSTDGEWQLWGTFGIDGLDGCDEGVGGGSAFIHSAITQAGPIGPWSSVFSTVRPMPSQNVNGRFLPFRINDMNGVRLVYSSNNDRACALGGLGNFRGMEIVLTTVSPVDPVGPAPVDFYAINPCRLLDTRLTGGSLVHGEMRLLRVGGSCGIPATARAVALNVTGVDATATGTIAVVPADHGAITTSTVALRSNSNTATFTIVGLSRDGSSGLRLFAVYDSVLTSADVVIDATGYFQ